MQSQIDTVEKQLQALITALDGQDAGAIVTATEELAAAVILLRGTNIPAGEENRAHALISRTLSQLEAAAIRVNILKNWTRQRIDKNRELRGAQPRGVALSY
ncbi:hypothetical protein [Sphingopyxis sp. MWB1]|uniref:hypothetical protein n=1 Tax=Sphingopyxis sp. MWB1 TaxID=1537715 RepID=UPI00051A4A24|nr:hypothetical protein [Sphingopyxis sp. MWB1]